MDKSYNFTLDTEPTEEQLKELMRAVLKDVKERATIAQERFKTLQKQQIKEAFELWHQKQNK
jgi:hypothetical protein